MGGLLACILLQIGNNYIFTKSANNFASADGGGGGREGGGLTEQLCISDFVNLSVLSVLTVLFEV